ncbi:rhodanese-like domain-containing protein [Muriicola sp.]|uniref:rhodanese-like domain-containing protein n=1 Tax=Muriicola sp. TaxID=2020856 RepID=UPI003C753908
MFNEPIFFGMMLVIMPVFGQRTLDNIMDKLTHKEMPLASVTELAVNPSYYRLDARSPEEFNISHLPDAHYIGYKDFNAIEFTQNFPDKEATYVVYCSVGIRSGKIGKKIKDLGYTNIKNLSGGLFKWVNDGYKILDTTGQPTQKVHAYNKFWGLLLNNGEKVYGKENQD